MMTLLVSTIGSLALGVLLFTIERWLLASWIGG
jgi:hypothetical protein